MAWIGVVRLEVTGSGWFLSTLKVELLWLGVDWMGLRGGGSRITAGVWLGKWSQGGTLGGQGRCSLGAPGVGSGADQLWLWATGDFSTDAVPLGGQGRWSREEASADR